MSDALICYYNILHKTMKWYRTLFFHFVDIAIVNSFIIHCDIARAKGEKLLSQKEYRESLILQLAGAGSLTTAPQPPREDSPSRHLPLYLGIDATQGRKRCMVCQQKTPVVCEACDKPFCFVSARNCFRDWHAQTL